MHNNNSSHQTHSTAKNYEVVAELGHGAQGSVYLVREEETQCEYAAKVYDKSDRLSLEERILKKLRAQDGFPQIVDTTEIDEQNVVIMQLLGDNLRTLKDRQRESRFSLSTALQILYQLISRLEVLHKMGYVHCDIKPDNMLIAAAPSKECENNHYSKGLQGTDSNVYLVDFGLAHSYVDRNGCHVKQPSKVSFKGTISYCSLNLLDKQYPSRRDDLESLIYVVLFLYYGQLPWHQRAQTLQGRERLDYVIRMKQDLHITSYGPDIPECILRCYEHVRELDYTEEPSYQLMKQWVAEDLKLLMNSSRSSVQIGVYDWSVPSVVAKYKKVQSPAPNGGTSPSGSPSKTAKPHSQSSDALPLANTSVFVGKQVQEAQRVTQIENPVTRPVIIGSDAVVQTNVNKNQGASQIPQQLQQHGANAGSPSDHTTPHLQQASRHIIYTQQTSQIRASGQIVMMKLLTHNRAEDHNESQSMEAEYQDFMSIEIDEGQLDFNLQGLEARANQLSSLSPCSPNSMRDSEDGGSSNNDCRRAKLAATIGGQQQGSDFNQQLKICLMPFDFAEDGEFDVAEMHSEMEVIKTQRKQSSFGASSHKTMEQIKRDRKFSMQQPIFTGSPIPY